MRCPNCGSGVYRQITPNWVECLGSITQWTGAHPSGIQGPPKIEVPCRFQFQLPGIPGPDGSICSSSPCGNYAIGVCVRCSKSVCGSHSRSSKDGRLCLTHAEEVINERKRAESAAAHERLVARERAVTKLREVCDQIVAASPPTNVKAGRRTFRRDPGFAIAPRRQPCPVHGSPCRVDFIERGLGWRSIRVEAIHCQTPGWEMWKSGYESAALLQDHTVLHNDHREPLISSRFYFLQDAQDIRGAAATLRALLPAREHDAGDATCPACGSQQTNARRCRRCGSDL